MIDDTELREKLNKIADLEKNNSLSGVSFATRVGARILTEQSVDYVIESIESGLEILEAKAYITV